MLTTMLTPSAVCSVNISESYIFTGCDDGTLRVYSLSGQHNVLKAVRGLGSEISSIACISRPDSKIPDVWVASGRELFSFKLDSPKMILGLSDAQDSLEVLSEDDVLNEICLDETLAVLAFSTDSGAVGVVDLKSKSVRIMKNKHSSICGSVKFILSRPREFVSAGYDHKLIHFDHVQGIVLSQYDISVLPSDVTSLSPPFILCLAVSVNGLIAAGTADGRLLIGRGGVKRQSKKSRKWNGLAPAQLTVHTMSNGPIVALAFSAPDILVFSSLLGNVVQTRVSTDEADSGIVTKLWEHQTEGISKVNALAVSALTTVIGGITADGKGIAEILIQEVS